MSRVMRKPAFCLCENKDADQLRGDREADQRLCFPYMASTIPVLLKYEISSLWSSFVAVQPGLCRTWSETRETGFLVTRLIWNLAQDFVMLVLHPINSYRHTEMGPWFNVSFQRLEKHRLKPTTQVVYMAGSLTTTPWSLLN